MKNGRPTFLFLKYGMRIGGIETYLTRLVQWLDNNDYRVVFLELKGTKIDPDFADIFEGKNIELIQVDIHKINWQRKLKGLLARDELIVAYAFSLYQYAMLEKIKVFFKLRKMNNFFWVPHFSEIFAEDEFPKCFRFFAKKYFGSLIKKLDQNKNIIYVNTTHFEALEKHYNFHNKYGNEMLVNAFRGQLSGFDEEGARRRSRRKPFNIITAGRFVFPHKGYLLGLIDSYDRLKKKYPEMVLTIIGYGRDEDTVLKKIEEISDVARRDVRLIGSVAPSVLEGYFKNASVHVGVAGSILDSAYCGVISIPVRHYTYGCEGYGYFTDMRQRELLVNDKRGEPIEKFIEQLISMSNEEYIELSKKTQKAFEADAYKQFGIHEMQLRNIDCQKHTSVLFILFVQMRYVLAGWLHKLKRQTGLI